MIYCTCILPLVYTVFIVTRKMNANTINRILEEIVEIKEIIKKAFQQEPTLQQPTLQQPMLQQEPTLQEPTLQQEPQLNMPTYFPTTQPPLPPPIDWQDSFWNIDLQELICTNTQDTCTTTTTSVDVHVDASSSDAAATDEATLIYLYCN